MPTVLRFGRVRVMIYTNDHRPAHVHAWEGRKQAVFNLKCQGGPVNRLAQSLEPHIAS
ncbi:hypothetical protein B1B_09084, partial [mine drainage metagenome]